MRRTPWALAAAAVALTGCSSVDSADIRTNGMKAQIVVWVAEGSSDATVEASLRVGTLTFVDLDKGEKLTARSGEESVTLDKANLLGATGYAGKLSGVHQAGAEVVVALQRTENDTSAPDSKVRLAEPIGFAGPESGTRYSRARQDIVIRIRHIKPDQGAKLTWSGDCVHSGELDVPAGQDRVTISRGLIRHIPPTATPTPSGRPTCKVGLTLTRQLPGTLDPAYGGGSIVAEHRASRDITSVP